MTNPPTNDFRSFTRSQTQETNHGLVGRMFPILRQPLGQKRKKNVEECYNPALDLKGGMNTFFFFSLKKDFDLALFFFLPNL